MVEEYKPTKLASKHRFNYIQNTICEHIIKGHRREQSFIRAGVSSTTLHKWWNKYQEETEAGLTDTVLIRFWTPILDAEARAEADIVDILRTKALDGDGKSIMYMLDKRYGWSSKQEVEVSAKDDSAISIEFVNMTDPHEEDSDDKSRIDSNSKEIHQ